MVLLKTPSPQRGDSQGSKSQPSKLADSTRRSRGNSPSERSNVSRGNSPAKATSSGSKNKSSNSWASKRSDLKKPSKMEIKNEHKAKASLTIDLNALESQILLDIVGQWLNNLQLTSGSIERLNDGDRKIVASKHLLPEDNINVVVRVRPLNEKEIKAGDKFAVQFPGDGQIQCDTLPNSNEKTKLFSYNVVFEPIATQEDVLQYSGIKKLIEMAVEGFSCTVFCYGQTGSGKTHTLTGPPGLFDNVDHYSEDHGLVFRSFVYLFKTLQERQGCNFVLKASFLEIYNEKIMDLLNLGSSKKSLPVRWSKKTRGFFVENLFTVECEELDDLLSVLEEGMKNRAVGAHNMNEHSSRSHTILTVHIRSEQQMENGVFISKQGKINFVDLAGSEMTKKTNSEGKTLEEANNINKSLMVLGYCIASLSDSKRKNGHIPYRDSKLTKLLADSLAGNGVTLMIACVSPARSNLSETLNTLRYAARAKKIRTKPIVVMDPREALILSLKREVDALQMENDHLKSTLHIGNKTYNRKNAESREDKRVAATPPQVDLDKLAELDNPELSQLVQAYLIENEALRRENAELYATRDQIIRDQELVCRENERLLKKLEDVNSVCCRSPIIPARPTYSAEMLSNLSNDDLPGATNVWTNPNSETELIRPTVKKLAGAVMPQKVLKELDKRIVGSFNNIAEAYKDKSHHRRYNSWDNGNNSVESPDQNGSLIDISHPKKSAFRRTSTVPEEMTPKSAEILGSHIPTSHSLEGTPDSLLSGPLVEGSISAPNTGDSVAPTTPFPPISRSTSPVIMKKEDRVVHKVFGSPVPIDRDDF